MTDNTVVVVPNSLIGTMILRNLSEPETKSRFELIFCLEFGVPPERALRVLEAGLKAAEGPLADPAPTVRIDKVSDRGVEYKVRYWVEPAQLSPPRARHAVTSSILRHLHQAGLSLAYDKQDVYISRMPARQLDRTTDRSTIIQRIEMFSLLSADERQQLAGNLRERRFAPGESVVQQGEEGESMYILVEGLLEVRSTLDDDLRQVKVSGIEPGQYFGEMSLLTGEPRAATVVAVTSTIAYELGKENLDALLTRRPEIAAEIAELMAKRRVQLKAAGEQSQEQDVAIRQSVTEQILDRMRHVFSSLRDTLISRHK
jgi:CRP-like cAMP-binding protein